MVINDFKKKINEVRDAPFDFQARNTGWDSRPGSPDATQPALWVLSLVIEKYRDYKN